ncbi:bifunctional UDP-sugar hydrolase/5'-nucleotidase [Corallococcus sp. Z5C101001]|uniref:bifunctional metallophosphatase/5'-nucleotidase n=1 Tax=Corallococcus sp. Z5C101001 TaxID=2596829 RepID=UPI00117EA64B|nr:bifunctional UDP-sugar hydrolase/5'-nucleotidase [Corallococcus sp. Z5C101001]TSC23615.1 bifunctional metallophosphatase/5'-nucleotidase [Corallococcus sp. Z5C101001]
MRSFRSTALALAVLAAACKGGPTPAPAAPATPPTPAATAPVRLTLVGTNDFHGWVMPHRATLPDGQKVEEGGAALFASYVERLREDNPGGVLLVDAGDLFQGTLASNLVEGAIVVDVYNLLGYSAVAIGNHEFDYGPVGPGPVATRPDEDPLGALKARMAQARFPFLSTNVREGDGRHPAWLGNDGTTVVTVKGVKVGLLGLSTSQTPQTTNPANVAGLKFESLADSALEATRSLREQGAEVVVAIAHAGGKCTDLAHPRDTSSCVRDDGEIYAVLDALPKGAVDAVVAGHTHQTMGHFFGDVPVIETTGMARSFGVVELFVDPVSHRVLPDRTRIQAAIPVCGAVDATLGTCDAQRLREAKDVRLVPATFLGKPVTPDARVEALVAPAEARVEEEQRRTVGVEVQARMPQVYEGESALGNLIADAMRQAARSDAAVMNAGGIRTDLPQGPLTFGKLYEVLPFDNTLAVLELSADELRRFLTLAYGGRKGVFAVSGLEVTLSVCPGPERLQGVTLPGGRPLKARGTYRVAVPDFLLRGGDGVGPLTTTLPPARIHLLQGEDLREVLTAYGRANGNALKPPALGRVHLVRGGKPCADAKP